MQYERKRLASMSISLVQVPKAQKASTVLPLLGGCNSRGIAAHLIIRRLVVRSPSALVCVLNILEVMLLDASIGRLDRKYIDKNTCVNQASCVNHFEYSGRVEISTSPFDITV